MQVKRFHLSLFCFFAAVYLLTFRGISVGDNVYHYEFVKSILQRQQLSLPLNNTLLATDRNFSPFFAIGRDDNPYLTLPPGLAVASLPLGSLGFLIENITADNSNETEDENIGKGVDISAAIAELRSTPSAIMTAMVNPLAMALLMVVFFNFSEQLGGNRKRALILTLLLGCCSIIWPFSSTYWTQPVTALCLFSALYFLYRFKEKHLHRYIVFAGLLAGYSILTRFETVVFVPFFLIYLAAGSHTDRNRIFQAAGLFLAAFGVFVLIIMLWNYYRFGGGLDTGAAHQHDLGFSLRGNLANSIPANLIGLNRSIFLYSPPLLLGLLAFPAMYRSRRILALVSTLIIVTGIFLYSKFSFWVTFISWGPRFMVILTPFLLLPASLLRFDTRPKRRLLLALAFAGICIQLIAVIVPYQLSAVSDYYSPGNAGNHFLRSDIVPQFKALFSKNLDFWWLADPITISIGILLILILFAAGIVLFKQYRSAGLRPLT